MGFPVNNSRSLELFFDKQIEKSMKRDSFKKHITEKDIFDERRKLIQKEYQKCMKSVHFPKDFLKTFISSYKTLRDTDYTLVFTDFYMLCRMFMKFDKSNSNNFIVLNCNSKIFNVTWIISDHLHPIFGDYYCIRMSKTSITRNKKAWFNTHNHSRF